MLCSQDKEIVADEVHKYPLLYGQRKNERNVVRKPFVENGKSDLL